RFLRFAMTVVLLTANFVALGGLSSPASAASTDSASLGQCTNGTVGPPVAPEPCQGSNISAVNVGGTDYKNWVNGNSNGQKSHWQEGEFISYRVRISGIPAGLNSLVADYKPEQSGLHAIDYLGSFDATETTSATAAGFHYNQS